MRTRHLHLTVGDRIGQTADVELPDAARIVNVDWEGGYVLVTWEYVTR